MAAQRLWRWLRCRRELRQQTAQSPESDCGLAASLDDHSIDDHVVTLERLTAAAPDGHVSVSCPGQTELAYLPFAIDFIEGQIIVTTSADSAVRRGDVLVSVDGQPAIQLLSAEEALVSGSPQWKLVGALQQLGKGRPGSTFVMRLRRGGTEMTVSGARIEHPMSEERLHGPIERLDDGIYYLDLSRASMVEINQVMDRLVGAPGIVVDVRDYPKLDHELLSHLLTHVDDLHGWELIPLVIRPDSASSPVGWQDTTQENMPAVSVNQHIRGRVAFLTGPRAISYAESIMALVEYYHLGEIVGASTAGTNGDIAQLTMPTGCTTYVTGRRVTKPDGSRHHLIGIQPTIAASRTIRGSAPVATRYWRKHSRTYELVISDLGKDRLGCFSLLCSQRADILCVMRSSA